MNANGSPPSPATSKPMAPLPPGFEDANHNRSVLPVEQLIPYEGQWVAWNGDSTRILLSDPDMLALDAKVQAAGIDPSQVIFEYINPPL